MQLNNQPNIKYVKIFLSVYILFLIVACFFEFPIVDSFYYWDWGQKLQLSYFDGPPLIGYTMWVSSHIFGNNIFALNIVGVAVGLISLGLVINIAKLLTKNNTYAYIIGAFWISYPLTITPYLFLNVTYDGLENLFSLGCLFFAFKYIFTNKVKYIYLIGVAGGFALLSKYSSIVMLAGLLAYFALHPKLRHIYRHPHLYVAMIICIVIFMPVLIWNYQNDFASFTYQLKYHSWDKQVLMNNTNGVTHTSSIAYYVISNVLGTLYLPFLLIGFIYFRDKNLIQTISPRVKQGLGLIFVVAIVIFIFWLAMSIHHRVNFIYMLYFSSLVLIIASYLLLINGYYRLTIFLILVFSCISVGKVIKRSTKMNDVATYQKYIGSGKIHSFIGY